MIENGLLELPNELLQLFQKLLQVLKEAMPVVKDLAVTAAAIGAIGAVVVGWKGLGTWRRQLKGNAEFDLARRLLTALYELREAISTLRCRVWVYSEQLDLPEDRLEKLSQEEKYWYALRQGYQKRWEPIWAAKTKLDVNRFEAEAIWGRDIVSKMMPLDGLIRELRTAVEDHLEDKDPNGSQETSIDEHQKRRNIMCGTNNPETDEFKRRLDGLIRDIEEDLKPHLPQYQSSRGR